MMAVVKDQRSWYTSNIALVFGGGGECGSGGKAGGEGCEGYNSNSALSLWLYNTR